MFDCDASLPERARAGLVLFNEGRYFEAHEELEAAWRDEPGEVRQLYQGILEAAVTYLHITRGNYDGALKVYGRSMRWLTQWPDTCQGVNVAELRNDLQAAIGHMQQLGKARMAEFDLRLLKPVVWDDNSRGN